MQQLAGNTIATPQHAPDYEGYELLSGEGAGSMAVNVWWESEETGTVIEISRGPGDSNPQGGYPSIAYRWVRNLAGFGRAGLEPVLTDIDFTVGHQTSAERPGYTDYRLSTPPVLELIERANNYQYPGHIGRRMKFVPYYNEIYSVQEYFEAMAEGCMLIPASGGDGWVKFHDVGDHMIVGLALSSELVGVLAQRARHILNDPHLLTQLRDSDDLTSNFLGTFDKGLFSSYYLRFLEEGESELKLWAKMLDTDVATVRGYAVRAREELRQIGETSRPAEPSPRRQSRLGSLLLRWLRP